MRSDEANGPRRVAMISTFPPTPCGIATFASALTTAMNAVGPPVTQIGLGEPQAQALLTLSRSTRQLLLDVDVVILQHEFGIYDGPDGDGVLTLLSEITQPTIVVCHTVPQTPTTAQARVLHEIVHRASTIVVMTEAGRLRLLRQYGGDPLLVKVIPHGAAVELEAPVATTQELLTWGLLGPGKGIEWAIEALAVLRRTGLKPKYRVAGATHPKVLARDGDRYRDMLKRQVAHSGLSRQVIFDEGYRSVHEISAMISRAYVVVLPYDSPDQVTSGVLVDAVAAGRPVIATEFPHALELLSSGAGLIVPRRDPNALALAIEQVFTQPRRTLEMANTSRRLAPTLSWSYVAEKYIDLVNVVRHPSAAVSTGTR